MKYSLQFNIPLGRLPTMPGTSKLRKLANSIIKPILTHKRNCSLFLTSQYYPLRLNINSQIWQRGRPLDKYLFDANYLK